MLFKATTLHGYKLAGLDGDIGKVKDLYFDDQRWAIRYLVADTGTWLLANKVLISPYALKSVEMTKKDISVNLTKKQIENSPPLSSHKPVSRQFEDDYYGYYGWPAYWGGSSLWGNTPFLERDRNKWRKFTEGTKTWNRHLRSTFAVTGYRVHALDGEIGLIEDFILDDDNWSIRYLVVATKNWWPGKRVLISPMWIDRMSWEESKGFTNLLRQTIKDSPEYPEEASLSRDYEIALHQHYNRKGYWIDELAAA